MRNTLLLDPVKLLTYFVWSAISITRKNRVKKLVKNWASSNMMKSPRAHIYLKSILTDCKLAVLMRKHYGALWRWNVNLPAGVILPSHCRIVACHQGCCPAHSPTGSGSDMTRDPPKAGTFLQNRKIPRIRVHSPLGHSRSTDAPPPSSRGVLPLLNCCVYADVAVWKHHTLASLFISHLP